MKFKVTPFLCYFVFSSQTIYAEPNRCTPPQIIDEMLFSHSPELIKWLSESNLSPAVHKQYELGFSNLLNLPVEGSRISAEEIKMLMSQMRTLPNTHKEAATVISFLSFSRSKNKNLYSDLSLVLKGQSSTKETAQFLELQQKFKKIEEKELTRLKNVVKAEEEQATLLARQKRLRYEQVYYGCRAVQQTEQNINAEKLLLRFSLVTGMGLQGYAYASAHWNEPKDAEWFKHIGYELLRSYVMTVITTRILGKPDIDNYSKALRKYLISASVAPMMDLGVQQLLFPGAGGKRVEEAFVKLKADPKFQEELKRLLQEVDSPDFKKRQHEESMKIIATTLIPMLKEDKEAREELAESLKLGDISKQLDKPEFKEVLLAAIYKDMYEQNTEAMFKFGSEGRDRYMFDRVYDAAIAIPGITYSLFIYNMMCFGHDRKMAVLAASFVLNSIYKTITSSIYYPMRKKAVNQ